MKKYKLKQLQKKIAIYLSFPQVWLFLTILILTVITLVLSFSIAYEKVAALFSNVFAGLVTGLVLSGLSGTRQIYLAVQKQKVEWINTLQEKISDYRNIINKFVDDDYDPEKRGDFIYDMGCYANWIKDFIVQSSFDKRIPFDTIKYCEKSYDFNREDFSEKSESLHDELASLESEDKQSVLDRFDEIDSIIRTLYSNSYKDLRNIEIKIATADRSII